MTPASMNLLDELARAYGHARFPAAPDEAASFRVNDDVEVFVVAGEDAIVLYGLVGDAPEGAPEFVEELLASNLFWRDTEGATLSLERYTRAILLARRHRCAEFAGADALDAELDRFAALMTRWQQVVERLRHELSTSTAPSATAVLPSQLA